MSQGTFSYSPIIIHKLPPTIPQMMRMVKIPAPALSAVVIFFRGADAFTVFELSPALGSDLLVPPVVVVTGTSDEPIKEVPSTERADI
jgi:hypothetical protein